MTKIAKTWTVYLELWGALLEGLDDRLVVVPAGGPGTAGEELLGPVHEAVRLRLEVEGDVVGGAERGLPVAHPSEEAEAAIEAAAEVKVVATSADVLVAGDDLVWALKAGRHSQSGGGAVAQAAVASRAPRSDAELEDIEVIFVALMA